MTPCTLADLLGDVERVAGRSPNRGCPEWPVEVVRIGRDEATLDRCTRLVADRWEPAAIVRLAAEYDRRGYVVEIDAPARRVTLRRAARRRRA